MNGKKVNFIVVSIFIYIFIQIINIFNKPLHRKINTSFMSDTKLNNTKLIIDNNSDSVKNILTLNYTFQSNNQNTTKRLTSKTWLKCHIMGRLGNNMFQAASCYGIAKNRNSRLCLDGDTSLLDSVIEWIDVPKQCPDNINFIEINENGQFATYLPLFLNTHLDQNIYISYSYLQSYKYFHKYDLPFVLKEEKWAQQWVKEKDIHIGIHIRRTDILNPLYIDQVPDIQYFEFCLDVLYEHLLISKGLGKTNVKVFIASDDMTWVSQQLVFQNTNIVYSPFQNEHFSKDFLILTQCPHLITSLGSYGWWTRYLNKQNGIKFYYSRPMFGWLPQDPFIIFQDYYMNHWTGITKNNITMYFETNKDPKMITGILNTL